MTNLLSFQEQKGKEGREREQRDRREHREREERGREQRRDGEKVMCEGAPERDNE